MGHSFKLFGLSVCLLFLAWIAKMHFVLGGDLLFRTGTIGIVLSFLINITQFHKQHTLLADRLVRLFNINTIVLSIAYVGMMIKVSHLMETQIEKDMVLDFLAIPSMVGVLLYNFAAAQYLLDSSKTSKTLFQKHILLPWVMLLFSFLMYAIFSAVLASSH